MEAEEVDLGGLRLLLVEDDLDTLEELVQMLESDLGGLTTAANGKEGLERFLEEGSDIVVTDVHMPVMDGLEMAARIREAAPEVPVVVLSAFQEPGYLVKALDVGVNKFLFKPLREEHLRRVLGEAARNLAYKREAEANHLQVEELLLRQDGFIKKIVHEMNTPLSVISLGVDRLRGRLEGDPELDSIKASVKVLSSIYEDISYMMGRERKEYRRKPVNLSAFIRGRIAYFNEIAQIKDIVMELYMDEEMVVDFNEIELQRLVDNNLSNAIKYTPEGGFVEVSLERREEGLVFEVKDNGRGMEDTERIFEKYYRTHPGGPGLGIGLATVREICDAYRIRIAVDSAPGRGSVFTYLFPPEDGGNR